MNPSAQPPDPQMLSTPQAPPAQVTPMPVGGGMSPAVAAARTTSRSNMMTYVVAGALAFFLCVLGMGTLLIMNNSVGFVGLFVGMLIATMPVPLYIWLALWLDRIEAEPAWLLALTFLWGATFATLFSIIFNTVGGQIVGSVAGAAIGSFYGTVISAPIMEEFSKGIFLVFIFFWRKDEFDSVLDGIIYAIMVGLGFAMVENFLYYGRALVQGGVTATGLTFFIRGMLSPFLHPLFTSMTGIGLGYARQTDKPFLKIVAPVIGFCTAMFFHAVWNFPKGSLPVAMLINLVLFMPVFLGLMALVYFSLKREGDILRRQLQFEVQSGLLTAEETAYLATGTGRLRSSMQALQKGGLKTWRARGQFNQTASELAFHRERIARGICSADSTAAECEANYQRRLSELREFVN